MLILTQASCAELVEDCTQSMMSSFICMPIEVTRPRDESADLNLRRGAFFSESDTGDATVSGVLPPAPSPIIAG